MPITVTTDTRIAPGVVQEIVADEFGGVRMEITSVTPPQFRNAGLLAITGDIGFGAYDRSFADPSATAPVFWNEAGGVLQLYQVYPLEPLETIGVSSASHTFLNEGVVEVWSASDEMGTVGVDFRGMFGGYFRNAGVLSATGGVAYGVEFTSAGRFTNTGRIEAFGRETAEGVRYSAVGYRDYFTNAGTIIAEVSDGSPYASIGIHSFSSSTSAYGQVSKFSNSGLVVGDYAFRSAETQEGLYSTNTATIEVVENTGEMRGVVFTAYGDDVVRNSGLIDGYVDLYQGDDLYDGAAGSKGAVVYGGQGADRLIGGSGADFLFGEDGTDTIFGGDGDDYVDGGRGADALDGGAGVDTLSFDSATKGVTVSLLTGGAVGDATDLIRNFEIVLGSRFADHISGSLESDVLAGLGGDDLIEGAKGDDVLYGDTGNDTLAGGLGADAFVFAAGDGHDVITDFTPGGLTDALIITGYSAYQSITQQGGDVLITLSAADSILLRNLAVTSLTSGDLIFQGAAPAPSPGSTLETVHVHENYVVSAGEVLEFINPQINYGLNQVRYASALVLDLMSTAATVANAGVIRIEASPAQGWVAAIDTVVTGRGSPSLSLVNQQTGVIEAHATNDALAIGIRVSGQVWNDGRIEVTSSGDAVGLSGQSASLVNSGHIELVAQGSAVGVDGGGGYNSGTISVQGGKESYGLRGGGMVNSGTIRVVDATAALDSVGVYYASGVTSVFFNSGVIEADYAIRKMVNQNTATPLDVIYNSGELRGMVDLGSGPAKLYNSGLIAGHVDLGADDDLYDGRLGNQTGGVSGGAGADTLLGGAGTDLLDGGAGSDIIGGGAGADTLTGGGGDDRFRFELGGGGDVITDFVAGGAEDSILVVGYSSYQSVQQVGVDTLVTFSATDSLLLQGVAASALTTSDFQFSAQALAPVLSSIAPTAPPQPSIPAQPAGPNFAIVGGETSSLAGGPGADTIIGRYLNETLTGMDGADLLYGADGNDILVGGQGEDRLEGGFGADVFVYAPGDGYDHILDFNPAEGDILRLVGYTNFTLNSFSWIQLSDGGRIDVGSISQAELSAAVEFVAGPPPGAPPSTPPPPPSPQLVGFVQGDGTLIGTTDNDLVRGGGGNDRLYGEGGDDRLEGAGGADLFVVRRGGGYDTLFDFNPAAGDVLYLEGYQANEVTVSSVTGVGTVIALADGGTVTTTLSLPAVLSVPGSIQFGILAPDALPTSNVSAARLASDYDSAIIGTDAGETLTGTTANDFISGLDGADVLDGGAGDDVLEGGDGNDLLIAGPGDDVYDGGAGYDTLSFALSTSGVVIDLRPGDVFEAGHGADLIVGIEAAIGSAFDDSITGQAGGLIGTTLDGGGGDDILIGTVWSDTLTGGDGNDSLVGGDRADILSGGAGDDTLDGGDYGTDTLTGGSGADTFVIRWGGGALVTDFNAAEDKLHLMNWSSYVSATASGLDTIVTLDDLGHTVLLQNFAPGQLSASNFIYYEPPSSAQIQVGDSAANSFVGTASDDSMVGFSGDDVLAGGAGDDDLRGGLGQDTLYGQPGDDRLRDGGETTNRDFLYGGAGDDTYYVTSSLTGPTDLVYEGGANPDLAAGANDVDVIYSQGSFFWDYYGVGEILHIDSPAGSQLVGGTNDQSIFGNTGTDVILAYGGSNIIDAGEGTDVIGFGLYGLDESYDGANTVVMKAGSGTDYVYDFESGVDKIDLTAFHFGITGQQVLDQAVNVDLPGTEDDHSYFYLTGAGGADNYIVFMGLFSSQLQASDFITGTP